VEISFIKTFLFILAVSNSFPKSFLLQNSVFNTKSKDLNTIFKNIFEQSFPNPIEFRLYQVIKIPQNLRTSRVHKT